MYVQVCDKLTKGNQREPRRIILKDEISIRVQQSKGTFLSWQLDDPLVQSISMYHCKP